MVFNGINSPIVPVATYASYGALVWSASLSAGAITSAKRIGVSSGTISSRGVRALSWNRRRARVSTGPRGFCGTAGSGLTSSGVAAVILVLLLVQAARN